MPDFKDEDFDVILSCRSAHPDRRGGQHVSKPCVSSTVFHNPTGLGVRVAAGDASGVVSQLQCRDEAMRRLKVLIELAVKDPTMPFGGQMAALEAERSR